MVGDSNAAREGSQPVLRPSLQPAAHAHSSHPSHSIPVVQRMMVGSRRGMPVRRWVYGRWRWVGMAFFGSSVCDVAEKSSEERESSRGDFRAITCQDQSCTFTKLTARPLLQSSPHTTFHITVTQLYTRYSVASRTRQSHIRRIEILTAQTTAITRRVAGHHPLRAGTIAYPHIHAHNGIKTLARRSQCLA